MAFFPPCEDFGGKDQRFISKPPTSTPNFLQWRSANAHYFHFLG